MSFVMLEAGGGFLYFAILALAARTTRTLRAARVVYASICGSCFVLSVRPPPIPVPTVVHRPAYRRRTAVPRTRYDSVVWFTAAAAVAAVAR